jgi:hypothetical protein
MRNSAPNIDVPILVLNSIITRVVDYIEFSNNQWEQLRDKMEANPQSHNNYVDDIKGQERKFISRQDNDDPRFKR